MSDRRKEESSRVIELERKLKKLQDENKNLYLGMKSLKKENEYLQAKLKKQERKHKSHSEHVNSLKDLAAQDREWLDTEISNRKKQMQQRKKETEATMAKRRATMQF